MAILHIIRKRLNDLALVAAMWTIQVLGIAAQADNGQNFIFNGIPKYDESGNIINAHGACIVEESGIYYLFGEYKSDKSNTFNGFSCYSSRDLAHWKFEKIVLGVQKSGILGPNRVGERVKVMKCPATGEFVMYMHSDAMDYKDPQIGYATCRTINGDYTLQGPLLYNGSPIRKWDMGTFQDTDGKGYLLIHHGIIYRLSDNYRYADAKVLNGLENSGESPAMFKKDGIYYLLGSGLTGWERNDNFYFTSTKIEGPWISKGYFAPEGSLTHNSQTTFVFPLRHGNDTIPMFMGDRWSYPLQASAASYVWMPMKAESGTLSIPEFWEAWDYSTLKPVNLLSEGNDVDYSAIKFHDAAAWRGGECRFSCDNPGAFMEIPFHGNRIAILGQSDDKSSYAKVTIINSKKEIVDSTFVDFYSKVPHKGVRYVSPVMPAGDYTLKVEVTGIVQEWITKKGIRYGSNGFNVNIDRLRVYNKCESEVGFHPKRL